MENSESEEIRNKSQCVNKAKKKQQHKSKFWKIRKENNSQYVNTMQRDEPTIVHAYQEDNECTPPIEEITLAG